MTDLSGSEISIYYDGECPFCRSYVAYADLKARYDSVQLIDARERPEEVNSFLDQGYDLDDGFIVRIDERIYSGGDAMWIIHSALAPEKNGLARIRNRRFLHFIYPALKTGRNLVLRALGKKKLNAKRSGRAQ